MVFEINIPNNAFQPKLMAMKGNVQPHGAATISTGGAAKWVNVPPTETFTKRIPIVAYASLLEGFSR